MQARCRFGIGTRLKDNIFTILKPALNLAADE
jgi:hypothetical protein